MISTCLYLENKKLKQHNAEILCFSNESKGSKINDIQTPKPYIREFRFQMYSNTQNKKPQMKRKKEDNKV